MIKKYSLIASLFISTISYSQNSPIDFEPNGNGSDWTWTTFENDDNPNLEIVTNPENTGDNKSEKVAKFIARSDGQPFAGCESKHGADIGTFTLNANTSQISMMVYKPVISDVGIKLVDKTNASLGEIKVANTKINTWEKLTFDFKSREGIEYDQIVIFIDFANRSSDNICYFDNIQFGDKTSSTSPKTPSSPTTEIYPNPSEGVVYVTSTENLSLKQYSIYNINGLLVSQGEFANTKGIQKIDLQHLKQGVYYMSFLSEVGVVRQRIIIR